MTEEPQPAPQSEAAAADRAKRRMPPGISPWYGRAAVIAGAAFCVYFFIFHMLAGRRENIRAFRRFQCILSGDDEEAVRASLKWAWPASSLVERDGRMAILDGEAGDGRDRRQDLAQMKIAASPLKGNNWIYSADGGIAVLVVAEKVWRIEFADEASKFSAWPSPWGLGRQFLYTVFHLLVVCIILRGALWILFPGPWRYDGMSPERRRKRRFTRKWWKENFGSPLGWMLTVAAMGILVLVVWLNDVWVIRSLGEVRPLRAADSATRTVP